MAQNISPIFILNGNFAPGRIAAANTASDGSGSLVTIATAGANGTRVDGVRFRNAAAAVTTSVATRFCIFLSDTLGTNYRLIGEVAQAAGTIRSATQIGATSIYTFDQPIIMKSGQIMAVTSSNWATIADNTDACAFAGDY